MESIYLQGSERVEIAASSMRYAAYEMQRAAASITYALEMHHRFLDDWLMRFRDALEKGEKP